jgi:hypothetical protein
MKFQFSARIAGEGSKNGPVLNIPARFQLPANSWYRLTIPGYSPCFVFGRPRYRCTALLAVPPSWNFVGLKVGDAVEAQIETVEDYRAKPPATKVDFDWLDFVDSEENFATEENGILRLWSRYSEPFDLIRFPDLVTLYGLLGLYQAEGSKSEKGHDFTLANTNVPLLTYFVETLDKLGIPKNRLYLESLHELGEDPKVAEAKYTPLGLEIAASRLRPGRGKNAGVIHARNSGPFKSMICRVLAHVFANSFPNRETALEYALRWLDGDGSITQTSTNTELRLAGLAEEHSVLKKALVSALQWDLSCKNTEYKDSKEGTAITLRTNQMADLLDAGAFPFSMSRVRLLLGFDLRAADFSNGHWHGAYSRWGFANADRTLTKLGLRIQAAYHRYKSQIEMAKQLWATSPSLFGVKSVALPAQFKP